MRITIIFLVLLFSSSFLKANPTPYDKLIYKSDTTYISYYLEPTIVEKYFIQNRIENKLPDGYYPYRDRATSLYRIVDNKLYLLKIVVGDSLYAPSKFEIFSTNQVGEEKVYANWFTGVISCYDDCYFKIIQGNIVEVQCLNSEDRKLKSNGIKHFVDNSPSKRKAKLIQEYYNYISFNFNLREDTILFNDTLCELMAKERELNPIFEFNNKGCEGWPYNWENLSMSGAPLCTWVIKEDSMYLKVLYLKRNFLRESYTEILPFDSLFNDSVGKEKIFANWVNGIFSFYTVKNIQEKKFLKKKIDKETHYLFKVEKGIIVKLAKQSRRIYNGCMFELYNDTNTDREFLILEKEYNSL